MKLVTAAYHSPLDSIDWRVAAIADRGAHATSVRVRAPSCALRQSSPAADAGWPHSAADYAGPAAVDLAAAPVDPVVSGLVAAARRHHRRGSADFHCAGRAAGGAASGGALPS